MLAEHAKIVRLELGYTLGASYMLTSISQLDLSRLRLSIMSKSQKAPKFLTTPPPSHESHLVISYPVKHVLQLTLNRPRSLNAMTDDLKADIARVMDWFEGESSLWVVIVTGNGRAFCAGQDLKNWKKKQDTGSRREAEEMAGDTNGFGSLARRQCVKPIIAAVNGIAMGGGVEILLNCDLVVASRDAKLGLPEVKRGVVAAAGGIPRIQRIAGHQFAAELLLTGRTITAEEAHTKYRFVTTVVPQAQVLSTAINLAKEIISNSPDAVWSTKKALLEGQQYASLEEAVIKHNLSAESKRVYQGDNIREGLAAFSEKRKPVWTNPKL
ncbi:enoyl-CoA hydratase [Rhizoctonia solani AG-1 IB]|uniref:Enoyl-CoA hydratase n=1 Tax=Thanatephorus cucumeris (strain AG1-IB / isolate 7/3/14) TaxID=1108050 RepID=A0A0B7F8I8_THACB|nr:enoyl-CoA hydratase [Rhizoctonia solani AG-1 IB]